MQNRKKWRGSMGWVASGVLVLSAGVALSQDAATPPDASATANEQQPTPAAPQDKPSEETIESAATGRPSLDYEPSESISEDSSVSFPVDI